ncbi:MAG: cytochrome c [Bacteroidetes bacterium]|nr:cytochrome c [Bacteroidota bacterium]
MKQLKAIILLSVAVIAITGFKTKHTVISISVVEETIKTAQPIPFSMQTQIIDTSKWVAPSFADSLVNPIPVNEETIAEGLLIYKKTCRSCHGRKGDGKGVEAADLSTPTTDFTNSVIFEQSDGSLFWKTSEGRNDMDPMKDDLSEEEIWKVINYIKTFSQPSEE